MEYETKLDDSTASPFTRARDQGTCVFRFCYHNFILIDIVPLMKDLHQHVTPHYAAHWKNIGIQLDCIQSGELETIEATWPTNKIWCCDQMLEMWLRKDPSASWSKIRSAIEKAVIPGMYSYVSSCIAIANSN